MPRLTHRIDHIRTFAFCTALVAMVVLVLVQALVPVYGVWLVLRVLQALLLVGLYAIIESWLNAAAEPSRRSSVFAIYTNWCQGKFLRPNQRTAMRTGSGSLTIESL